VLIANQIWHRHSNGSPYTPIEVGQGYSILRDTLGNNLPLAVCFGRQVCNGDGTRINFPVGFNGPAFVQLTPDAAPVGAGSFSVHVNNVDASGFSVAVRYNTAPATHHADVDVHWLAIGKRPSW
jgi:hypothetical protein